MYHSKIFGYLDDLEKLSDFFKKKENSLDLIKTSSYANTLGYENLYSLVKNFKIMSTSVKYIFLFAIENGISKYEIDGYSALREDVFEIAKKVYDEISYYQNLITFTKRNSLLFKGNYISYN